MPLRNYTTQQYRSLANPIEDEGGWYLEDNPNRNFYEDRSPQSVLLICMHITDGIKDETLPDTSAESTAHYGATTANKVSWHVVIDSDSIIPCLKDRRVGWTQGVSGYNFNRPGIGVEIGTKGTDWHVKSNTWKESTLRNVAVWLAPRVMRYNIPLVVLRDRDEIQRLIYAGRPVGFCSHGDLDINNRTDPGIIGTSRVDTFPWATLFKYIREEIALREGNVVLKVGSRGEAVAQWQQKLADMLYPVGAIDGVFGPNTDAQTRIFQEDAGLVVDGVVGTNTQKGMNDLTSQIVNELSAMKNTVGQVLTELAALKTKVDHQIRVSDEEFTTLLTTTAEIDRKAVAIDTRINEVNALIKTVGAISNEAVNGISGLTNSIRTDFVNLSMQIDNLDLPTDELNEIEEILHSIEDSTAGAVLRRLAGSA